MNYMNAYEDLRNSQVYSDYSLSFNSDEALFEVFKEINMLEIIGTLNKYPHNNYSEFKNLLCSYYGEKNFVLGSGSEDLIWRINNLILKNKRTGVVLPNFYRIYQTLENPCFINVPFKVDGGILDTDCLMEIIKRHSYEAIWISNPNPITGKAYYACDLTSLISSMPDVLFIVDEASVEATLEPEKYSILTTKNCFENLIVIRTFSKFYGLPGMRLGYATTSNALVSRLEEGAQVFPVSNLSVLMAKKIFENQKVFEDIRNSIDLNKKQILSLLQYSSQIFSYESLTHTMVIGCKDVQVNLWELLRENGIITLSLNDEKDSMFSNCVRLTIHSSQKSFCYLYNALKASLDILNYNTNLNCSFI